MYIDDKYTFKINNVVTYHHRGSTCDPAGILILVLLTIYILGMEQGITN